MKKNFKPLVLLAATVFSVGLTSCVDNEIAPEVKSIYEKQAEWIDSQSEVSLAEARYKDSQSEYNKQQTAFVEVQVKLEAIKLQIAEAKKDATIQADLKELEAKKAQQETALFEAQVALEKARKQAEFDAFKLQFDLMKQRVAQSSGLFDQYVIAKGKVINLTEELNGQKRALITANKNLAIYTEFDKDNDPEGKVEAAEQIVASSKRNVSTKENALKKAQGKYDALMAKRKGKEAVIAERDKLKSDIAAAKIDSSYLAKEVEKLNKQQKDDYGQFAEYDAAKKAYEKALKDYNDQENILNKAIKQKAKDQKLLEKLGLSDKSIADLEADKAKKQTALDDAEEAYDDVKDKYNTLNADFKTALDKYAAAKLVHDKKDEAVKAEEKKVADAQKAYDKAKADFDKDPNGAPLVGGNDGKAGDHSDNNGVTYYKLSWDGTEYSFVSPIVAKDKAAFQAANPTAVIVDNYSDIETAEAAKSGALAGDYFDVEADDVQGTPYKDTLAQAEKDLKAAKDNLADVKAAAEADEKNFARAEKEYNRVHTLLNEGKQKLDAAEVAKDTAEKALKDATDGLDAAKNIANFDHKVKGFNFTLANYKAVADSKMKELKALEAKVSEESLKAYKALLKSIVDKEFEVANITDKIKTDEYLVNYYNGLLGVEKITDDDLKAAENNVNTAKRYLSQAKAGLAQVQAELARAEAGKPFNIEKEKARLNDAINTIKAQIAKLEEQIKVAEQEAAKYKSLYEESVKTKA